MTQFILLPGAALLQKAGAGPTIVGLDNRFTNPSRKRIQPRREDSECRYDVATCGGVAK